MNLFTLSSRIIITCSNRLSPWLLKETEALGYKAVRTFKTGVELQGTLQECIQLNLNHQRQISADAKYIHHGYGKQHCERNNRGD